MPVSVMQLSFAGGEWSPSLYGRVDLAKYPTSVRQCKNFVIHPHGGVSNRGGTEFVCEVKDSTKTVKLVPFEFSVTQSYILEFGDYYMRVIKDGGQVVLPSTPTAWNNGTAYVQGDHCSKSGTNYYALQAGTNKDPATETAYWHALSTDIVEIVTPYAEADLPLLKFSQSYDVLYLVHPSYAPRKLSRTAHHTWTLTTTSFGSSLATPTGLSRSSGSGTANNWVVTAVAADGEESLAPSSVQASAGDSLSWNAVSGADHYNVYMDTGGGSFAFVTESRATTCKLPTTITYTKTAPLTRTPFSGTSLYPGVAEFFEQRLWYGRTNAKPQTIWGSQTGNYDNMNVSSPLRDDDACEFTISARQVNEIRGLVSLGDLVIFTSGGEWRMTSGSNSDAVTPTSVDIKQQSKWGSSHLRPILVGNTVLFVGAAGNVIRDFLYDLNVNGYAGNDLTLLANHLLRTRTVVDWAYQQYPDSVIWAVTDDGKLLGMTYAREHEVWAWHQHDTDGLFENVASIPASDGRTDVYFVVNRTIGGSTKRYIEYFHERLEDEDVTLAWFVDCGLSLNNWNKTAATLALSGGTTWAIGQSLVMEAGGATPFSSGSVGDYYVLRSGDDVVRVVVTAYTDTNTVTVQPVSGTVPASLRVVATADWASTADTVSGLDHLEGKEVVVLADGNVVTGLAVASGEVTLPRDASVITVGLAYEQRIETMEVEIQGEGATLQDRHRNIQSATLRLENTRGLWAGPDDDNLFEIAFRENENMGDPIALFTGDKEIDVQPGDNKSARIVLANSDPVPISILSLILKVAYGDF